MPDWVWLLLGALVAITVGTLLAYALAAPGGRPRRRDAERGRSRYEVDNAIPWNPWAFVTFGVLVGGLVAVIVLFGPT